MQQRRDSLDRHGVDAVSGLDGIAKNQLHAGGPFFFFTENDSDRLVQLIELIGRQGPTISLQPIKICREAEDA